MKNLITGLTGGRPFYNDDITLLNDTLKEITSLIAKGIAIGETAYILTGCEITVNDSGLPSATLDLTAGAIWYLDEIYQVVAVSGQSIPNVTQQDVEDNYEWDLLEVVILNAVYKDNISKDMQNNRTAVLLASSVTWSGLSGLKNITDLLITAQATETLQGKAEIATIAEVELGTDNDRIVSPLGLQNITGSIKRAYIEIGDWDMDTDDYVLVPHSMNFAKIIGMYATVKADASTTPYPLSRMDSGYNGLIEGAIEFINFSNVKLTRRNTGFFDSTSFNDTGYNRGWIIIEYIS